MSLPDSSTGFKKTIVTRQLRFREEYRQVFAKLMRLSDYALLFCVKKSDLEQFVLDDQNANAGTKRGRELLAKSVKRLGLGRSIVVDKNNRVIAGNKTFSGSGTQLCAAQSVNRICYAMEIEPKYVAVALERLSEMGLKPKLIP